jgi:hypothetical protein
VLARPTEGGERRREEGGRGRRRKEGGRGRRRKEGGRALAQRLQREQPFGRRKTRESIIVLATPTEGGEKGRLMVVEGRKGEKGGRRESGGREEGGGGGEEGRPTLL